MGMGGNSVRGTKGDMKIFSWLAVWVLTFSSDPPNFPLKTNFPAAQWQSGITF
jgi:hypothetical protein